MTVKKDKGFEIFYWNLSYRRKFIRTLWIISLIIPESILVWHFSHSKILAVGCFIILTVIGVIQAIYLYKKWKNELSSKGFLDMKNNSQ